MDEWFTYVEWRYRELTSKPSAYVGTVTSDSYL